MSESGPALAWVEAVNAAARIIDVVPLPKDMVSAESGDWKLTVNVTGAPCEMADGSGTTLQPFDIFAQSTKYFVFAILSPSGGCIGGMPEDDFIAEMKSLPIARATGAA